jgi:hypothetical protein
VDDALLVRVLEALRDLSADLRDRARRQRPFSRSTRWSGLPRRSSIVM